MIAHEEVSLGGVEPVEPMGSAQVRNGKAKISADSQESLNQGQFACDTRLASPGGF